MKKTLTWCKLKQYSYHLRRRNMSKKLLIGCQKESSIFFFISNVLSYQQSSVLGTIWKSRHWYLGIGGGIGIKIIEKCCGLWLLTFFAKRSLWRRSGVFIVNFEPFFSVSIVDFKKVNACWASIMKTSLFRFSLPSPQLHAQG